MSEMEETILSIRLQPAAKKDEFCGWLEDGTLKLRVRGKPVEGKANENLILFLSKSLNIPKTGIQILSGEKSRHKRVQVRGLSRRELTKRVQTLLRQEP